MRGCRSRLLSAALAMTKFSRGVIKFIFIILCVLKVFKIDSVGVFVINTQQKSSTMPRDGFERIKDDERDPIRLPVSKHNNFYYIRQSILLSVLERFMGSCGWVHCPFVGDDKKMFLCHNVSPQTNATNLWAWLSCPIKRWARGNNFGKN